MAFQSLTLNPVNIIFWVSWVNALKLVIKRLFGLSFLKRVGPPKFRAGGGRWVEG